MNTIFRRLPVGVIVLLLALSRTAFAELNRSPWRDLVPPLDESLILEGDIAFGEQVRFELNNKEIRIPGFIVPVDFDDTQVSTIFAGSLLRRLYTRARTATGTKPSTQNLNLAIRWKVCGTHFGSKARC